MPSKMSPTPNTFNMRALLLAVVASIALVGCRTVPPPGLSLNNADMADGPVLVQRDDHFYLHYRRKVDPQGQNLLPLVEHKRKGDAVYYYFSIPTSATEWGNVVERPLAYDGYEEFARQGKVFWLDPDGTTHPIPVRKE